jgi:hypothetical protein
MVTNFRASPTGTDGHRSPPAMPRFVWTAHYLFAPQHYEGNKHNLADSWPDWAGMSHTVSFMLP